jgi:uncharacterized protein
VKIVFDTNVLFSAFVAHGTCAGLYEECLQRAQIVVSPDILKELEKALREKARLTAAETRDVMRAVRMDSQVVKAVSLSKAVCRDADDDRVLGAAVAAEADAVVTGDQDLLVLRRFKTIAILNPRDCLEMLAAN